MLLIRILLVSSSSLQDLVPMALNQLKEKIYSKHYLQNIIFLLTKTEEIFLNIWDSSLSDVLSDVPPHT